MPNLSSLELLTALAANAALLASDRNRIAVGQAEKEAGAEERVVGQSHSDLIYKLLNHARALARSGGHADHKSIIPHLEAVDGFAEVRSRIEERAFRAQLDRICALARGLGDLRS